MTTGFGEQCREEARAKLATAMGAEAQFRDGQLEAICALVDGGRRALVVQATGWGKSMVYFIATAMLRERGKGPTILVSPLLALMRDQLSAAHRLGLRSATINSSNTAEWREIENQLLAGQIDLLLVSPERFNNDKFRSVLLQPLTDNAGLFVIDEAHCASDWGHDFRPDYRRLSRIVELLPSDTPVLATTATANNRVVADLQHQLGDHLLEIRGPLARRSLQLKALRLPYRGDRLAWLAENIPHLPGTGIVYCQTIGDAELVSEWLNSRGIHSRHYTGEVDGDTRIDIENALMTNQVKVVCATSALGMGLDKPDLAFVIHYQSPNSPVAYYQQVGRAGRAIPHATGVLLLGNEDQRIWDYFLETSQPGEEDTTALVQVLEEDGDWLKVRDLEPRVNLSNTQITSLLKVLDVEGAVERDGTKYRRSLRPWAYDLARLDRVRESRIAEQNQMLSYIDLETCRMAFLQDALDDPEPTECGRCDNCTSSPITPPQSKEERDAARLFLTRLRPLPIEPRKVWAGPQGNGRIPAELQSETGVAACRTDDAWGEQVLTAKRDGKPFSPELVARLAKAVRQASLTPKPEWITYVPATDPARNQVQGLALALGQELGLPVHDALTKLHANEPQKKQLNSAQQVANVLGAFQVQSVIPAGPVLLVDDIVDSRWTLTVLTSLLREAGSGPVFPTCLARSKG
jgi:ATP-dependent DNA helicase RecQ